ncbi:MAG: SDR family NAD(P)-dependent oxidoreductase [Proteobacteria bacterium]|nr:SDR family NAD(P)-dependent oxidoreductase [Pseudomonadota bacterium]MDA1238117.1 SDR family NAD(P)-dependent oxidoreductase [Pseudomonadota bacterium]
MKNNEIVALVTGGASGLGEASVRELISKGAKVAILDRDQERGKSLAKELGSNVMFVPTDVTSEESVVSAISQAKEKYGFINVVVNCAGIAVAEKTVGKDGAHKLASFNKTLNINLSGSFNVSRLASEAMQSNSLNDQGERGVIINTASVAAFDGQKGQVAYAASKGGVASMTLPMARDLAQVGIRVLAIAPGLFMTPMLVGLPEKALESLSSQPLFPQRLGDPKEFGELVLFMIGAAYLNAEVVRLDAGIRLP